ncbi:MAG: glucoamylase family protein, partial [Methanosarcinales archaeon]
FKDAFNLDTNVYLDGCQPWWDEDYIGIDEGAIMLMIENHRSGFVWDEFMQNENIKKAMDAAGFMERGDVNSDHVHDKDDILALINHVGSPAVHPIDPWTGDVNCDGSVNMGDVILLLNHLGDSERYVIGC